MFLQKPEWTIGIVNYNSSVYMKWQLKIMFEANDPACFRLIIVDNSVPHQKQELEDLTREYSDRYNNIEIVYLTPKEASASGQHGEGLDLVQKKTTTKYLLVHDPDFFWVKDEYLNCFKEYLERSNDNIAIGAPYPNKIGVGDPWFPSAYGCAYKASALKEMDFLPGVSEEDRKDSYDKYPVSEGFEFSYDVGWKIRERLSNKSFSTFAQREAYELKKAIGVHSFDTLTREYFYQSQTIGFHLFRGTFTGVIKDHKDPNSQISNKWLVARDNYGSYFYKYKNKKSKILFLAQRSFYKFITITPFLLKKSIYSYVLPAIQKTEVGRSAIKNLKQFLIKKKIISRPYE